MSLFDIYADVDSELRPLLRALKRKKSMIRFGDHALEGQADESSARLKRAQSSILMPVFLANASHFTSCASTSFLKSSPVTGVGSNATSVNFFFVSGSRMMSAIVV